MHMEAFANQVFRALADAFSYNEQEHFFELITERLAHVLQVDHVLVARVIPGQDIATALAFYSKGQQLAGAQYALAGTPCETVNEAASCLYNNNVAAQFPQDAMLVELGAEAYFGYPVLTRAGEKLGIVALLHSEPFANPELLNEVLRIVGAFLATELERRSQQQAVYRLAFTDSTTGLPNRAAFLKQLRESVLAAKQSAVSALTPAHVSVIMMNICRFKEINDTYGHAVGDAVLLAVGERLLSSALRVNCVARLGADEFAFLTESASEHTITPLPLLIESIKSAFAEPINVGARSFSINVVIGAAKCSTDGYEAECESLLQRASIALDHARVAATQSRIYDASMSDALLDKQFMLERLMLAIETNSLSLHYQPQFDLLSGKLVGAEALCRWYDEELGWVSPMVFIPLAEERDLIYDIGNWVVRTAATQLQMWGSGFPGYISVNISACQFDDLYMADYILEQTQGIEPGRFVVELTESIMMHNSKQALRQLGRLSEHGIRVAVDDFGTGFSSLAYLTQFPISMLKIDRSFVQKLATGAQEYTVAATIIAMAKALNLSTVAEGVETEEQENMLRSMGCHHMQGFFRGKPVPAEEFAKNWLD